MTRRLKLNDYIMQKQKYIQLELFPPGGGHVLKKEIRVDRRESSKGKSRSNIAKNYKVKRSDTQKFYAQHKD